MSQEYVKALCHISDSDRQASVIAEFVALPRPDGFVSVVLPRIGTVCGVRVTVHTATCRKTGEVVRHVVQSVYPESLSCKP